MFLNIINSQLIHMYIYKCIYAYNTIDENRGYGFGGGQRRGYGMFWSWGKGTETWLKYNPKTKDRSVVIMTDELELTKQTLLQQILNYFVTLSLYTFMLCKRGNGSLCRCQLYSDDEEQYISTGVCFKQHSLLSL